MSNFFLMKLFAVEAGRALSSSEPQRAFAELAQRCPVHHAPDGAPLLTRSGDITAINLRRDVRGPGGQGPTMLAARPLPPLDLDGADHLKYRRLLDPLFSSKKVAELEPAAHELADQLIDRFIDAGAADLQAAFCQPLPSILFLRMMGLPAGDLAYFVSFKDVILGHLPPSLPLPERLARQRAASQECYAYLARILDERAARDKAPNEAPDGPEHDLLGWLTIAELDGQRLARDTVLDITYLLILAGLDTIAASLACMLARLARDPDLRRQLVAHPERWPGAIEELLRLESPVQFGFRVPTVDIEIGGELIRAGTMVYLCWSSANLDPAVFVDPLTMDPARRPNPHLAFGSGFHKCLGIHLARMELRVALEALHRRIPDYTLDGELEYTGMPRAPSKLPLRWR